MHITDFVNGTRFIYPIEDKSMRFQNKIGNFIFRFLVSIVIQNKLSDTLCGTKVFRKSHIKKILEWRKDLNYLDPFGDFDFLFSAAYCGEKIVEYPVHYKARVYGETQIRRYRDGFKECINNLINSEFVISANTIGEYKTDNQETKDYFDYLEMNDKYFNAGVIHICFQKFRKGL